MPHCFGADGVDGASPFQLAAATRMAHLARLHVGSHVALLACMGQLLVQGVEVLLFYFQSWQKCGGTEDTVSAICYIYRAVWTRWSLHVMPCHHDGHEDDIWSARL